MLFRFALVPVSVLLLFSSQVSSAAVNPSNMVHRAIETATDPYSACNCPNNCSHKEGSSCTYYAGPSDSPNKIHGTCSNRDGKLTCIAK